MMKKIKKNYKMTIAYDGSGYKGWQRLTNEPGTIQGTIERMLSEIEGSPVKISAFAEVERRGIMMPILEVQSKYRKPAYFDELLTVRIILREMPSTRINFFYEIYNERGDLLNTGMTQLGFIHSDSRRPCRCPEWFLELIRSRWTE